MNEDMVYALEFSRKLAQLGYVLTGNLGGALILGGVFFLGDRKRRDGLIGGVVVCFAIQPVAYHIWKDELPAIGGRRRSSSLSNCWSGWGLSERSVTPRDGDVR